ncbi:hypothetical protein [Teredinibacter turnerae]|uniref:hypothetical protein n=1 Tax=Teredinibacter turnerae TaxID=2426 RepID=UPI001E5675E5|nr:hypothetical protein [Teredinibacter turnerae]
MASTPATVRTLTASSRRAKWSGLSLVELMVALVVVVVLIALVIPLAAYLSDRANIHAAQQDLLELADMLGERRQAEGTFPALAGTTSSSELFPSWQPNSTKFQYVIVSSGATFEVTANGRGRFLGCSLSIDQDSNRTAAARCPVGGDHWQ